MSASCSLLFSTMSSPLPFRLFASSGLCPPSAPSTRLYHVLRLSPLLVFHEHYQNTCIPSRPYISVSSRRLRVTSHPFPDYLIHKKQQTTAARRPAREPSASLVLARAADGPSSPSRAAVRTSLCALAQVADGPMPRLRHKTVAYDDLTLRLSLTTPRRALARCCRAVD